MKKVILFDLYDTILKNISFDFVKGIEFIYNRYFTAACTQKDLEDVAETFLPLYKKRNEDQTEICLIKDEVSFFFDKFGLKQPDNILKLEYLIMNEMQNVTLLDDVRNTLNELHEEGITLYILSNSIFTSVSAKLLLDKFGVLNYFSEVFSSADYGIRKPSSAFYNFAINKIMDEIQVLKNQISYMLEMIMKQMWLAAKNVGLDTVWYNVMHLPNHSCLEIDDIDEFNQVKRAVYR